MPDVVVQTLPPEFLPKEIKKKPWFTILLISMGVLILVGVGITAYYLVLKQRPAPLPPPPSEVTPPIPPPAPGMLVPPPTPPIEEPPPPTPPSELPITIENAPDDDADGLSNDEEILFKTDSANADTDGDTFIDGNEVFNLYNPAQSAPVNLIDSGLVKVFNNSKQNYELFYPSEFTLDIIDTTSTAVVAFKPKSGEKLLVTVIQNTAGVTPLNYYLTLRPEVSITEISSVTTKGGLLGIRSPNRLETVIAGEGVLYSIVYDLGGATLKRYSRTYEMMINSFKIK